MRYDTTPESREEFTQRVRDRLRVTLIAYYSLVTDLPAGDVINLAEQTLVIMDDIQASYERVIRTSPA